MRARYVQTLTRPDIIYKNKQRNKPGLRDLLSLAKNQDFKKAL